MDWVERLTGGFIRISEPVNSLQYVSLLFWCAFVCLCVTVVLLQLAFFVDVFRRDFGKDNAQPLLWLVLMIVGFPITIVFYYFFVCNKYPLKR